MKCLDSVPSIPVDVAKKSRLNLSAYQADIALIQHGEGVMKASDSFAIILILFALSYAVSMFVGN